MAVPEVVGERGELRGHAGVSAAVEAVVQRPVPGGPAERFALEAGYRLAEEAALEDREADGALPGGQSGGESREGSAGAAGDGDDLRAVLELSAESGAAFGGEGVGAALGDDEAVAEGAEQSGQYVGVRLAAVGRTVHEVQPHAVRGTPGQGRVQRA